MSHDRLRTLALVMEARASRRHALHGLGLGASGLALALATRTVTAGPGASPASRRTPFHQMTPVSGSGLDALDDETKANIAQALWLMEWDEEEIPQVILETLASNKNSNRAFGERMTARLQALIDEPESFTPSYGSRYEAFLQHSDSLSPHQAYSMANLLGPDSAQGFPPLPPKADFVFPKRHAVDLPMQVGWYFVVGSCMGSNGKEYGVELMFFRNALLPPAMAHEFGLTDEENQITELHFAVTEAGGKHHRAVPIVVAGTTGLLQFVEDGLGWSMGNNTIQSLDPEQAIPLHFRARGVNRRDETPIEFSIDIVASASDPLTRQGVDGCDPCCDGAGTLYYSVTNLSLDPSRSTLSLDGEDVELVGGTFWFDHQWGNSLISSPRTEVTRAAKNLAPETISGWDWFMAQFDDGRQIAGAALHTPENLPFYFQTGETPPAPMEAPVKARLMVGDGTVQMITGTVLIDDWVKSTDSPDPDLYQPTNTWYPNYWRYSFGEDVPEALRSFSMEPIVEGGQAGFFASGMQYSEGATRLLDPDGAEIGRGFGESVNYADTAENVLRLAGLPPTDEMLELVKQQAPSAELVAQSAAYVMTHQKELNEVIAGCIGI